MWTSKIKQTRGPASDNGFTLLEIMVAVSIMAVVLISVYRMHAQTISMNNIAKFHSAAPLLAQRTLAEFEMAESDEQASDSGDFGDEFPGYTWTLSVDEVVSDYLETVAEDMKKVDITVSFNEGEDRYRLRAYRFVRFLFAPQARDSMASASSRLLRMALTIKGIRIGM